MPSTVWPDAQDALKAALDARPGLTGVPVTVGYPAGGPNVEHIWIAGQVTDWTREWETTAVANAPIREEFTLELYVVVSRRVRTFEEVRVRLLAILDEIEAAVTADFTLGGAVAVATLTGGEIQEGIDDERRSGGAELRVRCEADLAG